MKNLIYFLIVIFIIAAAVYFFGFNNQNNNNDPAPKISEPSYSPPEDLIPTEPFPN